MIRMQWPNLILLYYLNAKDRLANNSVMDIEEEEKRVKSDEIILILLVTIFMLFFFAQNVEAFLILLFSGLTVAAFALIKDYKERE